MDRQREEFALSFRTVGLADSFKSELSVAASRGEAFDTKTGKPVSMLRKEAQAAAPVTWVAHAREYAVYKWPNLAGTARVSVAEVLTTITMHLLPKTAKGRPADAILRSALRRWAFNGKTRDEPTPPDVAAALTWAEEQSPAVTVLADLEVVRLVLSRFARKLDGKPAAATYLARRRQVFYNVLKYAVTKKRLGTNPLDAPDLNWERPSDMEVDHEVDPRCIGSTKQVEQMLAAVSYVGQRQGLRFMAFFGCMYYGMLRPEEANGLHKQDCDLPEEGWGNLMLGRAQPAPGKDWTDNGQVHDDRGLKHRSRKAVRPVPIPPELVRLLRWHLDTFGSGPDGRIFRSVNGNPISPSTYNRVWDQARLIGLSPEQYNSVLLKRPYDLRHAGITVRLYAGVPDKQVAEWAGNSVDVLRRVYSKILNGFVTKWFDKINAVFGSTPTPDS